MKTEELVAVIDRGAPAGTAAVTLHLGSSEYADRALEALFDVLGDDPSPSDVDVVIDGDRVGMLRKEVLFALVQNGIMKMGDTSLEWRENKVFVQPTEADAATNLFIWTANQRLNYELEPADSVTNMDFAVDQAPVHLEPVKPTATTKPVPASPSITELLLAGKPVRLLPSKQRASKPVEVWISDLYEKDGRLLVRYTVCNHGTEPYTIDTPLVYQLDGVRSAQSLYGLQNSQLGDEQAAKLKIKQETPVKVLDGQLQTAQVAPGQEAVGVIALEMASSTQPTVLHFQFPSSKQSEDGVSNGSPTQIAAFLVR